METSSTKYIDFQWYKTAEGDQCIQQLYNPSNGHRKQFGLLERPSLSPGTTELTYKICLAGKAGSGKSKVVSVLSGEHDPSSSYTETVGIHVKDVYWPARIGDKINLFHLQFWEAGEHCAKKYSYISSGCMEKADAVAIVVNKSDKSTLDFVQGKHDSLAAACATLLVFVLDADTEATQISDKDLMGVSRAKRLPLFHLPQHGLPPKHLAPLLNSLCDFLFASAHRNDHAALTKHSSH